MAAVWLLSLFLLLAFSSAQEGETNCGLPAGVEAPEEVIIGGLNSVFIPVATSALHLAVDLINQDECLLPETRLTMILGIDDGTATVGLREFMRIQTESNPVGWAGFPFSSVSRSVALASPLTETPIVSASAALTDLSNAEVYPFFSRVIASDAYQGIILADLLDVYGWDRVATISVVNAWAVSVVEQFTNRAATYSIKFLNTATFPLKGTVPNEDYEAQLRSAIKKTKASGARIILLALSPEVSPDYFRMAMEEGLIGPPYTFLYVGGFTLLDIALELEDEGLDEQFEQSVRGIISLTPQGVQPGPATDEWVETWMSADPAVHFGAGVAFYSVHPILVLFRDSLYTLAHGIDRLIRRGIDPSDGNALLETIQEETDFVGVSGQILLQPNGDRYARYDVLNAQEFSSEMTTIGWGTADKVALKKETIFSDGTPKVPDAAERVYVDWDDAEAIAMVALFSFGLLVALFCLIVMMVHRSTPILNYSSPRFVFGMGVGVLVGLTNVFVWTGEPSSTMCEARPWLLALNFGLIFGHLYAKAFRFLVVMKQRKTLQFRPIPDIHLFLYVFFYLLLFVIPCLVWTVAFPLDVTRSDNNPDNDKVNIVCDGENSEVFFAVLLGLGGVSLLVGVVVAFLNRNYHDFFSEATYIGYTMFTVCITCCVVLPMLFILDGTPHAFYIVLMLGIFLGNATVVVFMFFPKVFIIFHPEINVVPIDATGALKTKKSSGSDHHRSRSGASRDTSKKSSFVGE